MTQRSESNNIDFQSECTTQNAPTCKAILIYQLQAHGQCSHVPTSLTTGEYVPTSSMTGE